jgi:rhamnogalacturonan endolyase
MTAIFLLSCLTIAIYPAGPPPRENLDRGLTAQTLSDGQVYLSWRLLQDEPDDIGFNVYVAPASDETAAQKCNAEPILRTTDYRTSALRVPDQSHWFVRPELDGVEGPACPAVSARAAPFVSIKLDGEHTFQKAGIADLDGDGSYDFVLKQPHGNIDPYEKYWKPSPGSYKLEAYRSDGRFLWRHDLGWAIEQGIWYSPYVVYDLDGDGRAEVAVKTGEGDPRDADGRVQSGSEYLTILDGLTGQPVTRVDWPSRDGFDKTSSPYNYASRNQLGVAYLDGRTPSLIVVRGTYNLIKVVAYQLRDRQLVEQWRWDNTAEPKTYWGQGAHWLQAADVDGDGDDELVLGSAVLDDDGRPLWSTGLGHPDHCYIGKIDPDRPGLQIYYGLETRQKANGMCLVDAATGKLLWGIDKPTRHVHGHGLCSDIDPAHPGSECYSADTDPQKDFAFALMHDSRGRVISEENFCKFGPRAVYWDADPQRELLDGGKIWKYKGPTLANIEGTFVAVADVLGDWREEIITSRPGELRIYTSSIPASDRRVCLMQDPLYRMNVVVAAMGYYQVPMTSYDVATGKR